MFKSPAVYVAAAVVMMASSSAARAQTVEHQSGWQFIVSSGKLVPTGKQRDAIKSGNATVAQLSYLVSPAFAVTGSLGWARTRDIATAGSPKLDMFTLDVGGEVRANRLIADRTWSFSPFAGAGAGMRSYNYRSLDADATHNLAGYAGAGSEIGVGRRLKVRIEARDYVSRFKPLAGVGAAETRNDVAIMVGLRLKVR